MKRTLITAAALYLLYERQRRVERRRLRLRDNRLAFYRNQAKGSTLK